MGWIRIPGIRMQGDPEIPRCMGKKKKSDNYGNVTRAVHIPDPQPWEPDPPRHFDLSEIIVHPTCSAGVADSLIFSAQRVGFWARSQTLEESARALRQVRYSSSSPIGIPGGASTALVGTNFAGSRLKSLMRSIIAVRWIASALSVGGGVVVHWCSRSSMW